MPSSRAKLVIEVGADVKGALKAFDQVGRGVTQMNRSLGLLTKGALVVGTVSIIRKGVESLAAMAKESADAAAEQQRLERAIANTGQAVDSKLIASTQD